MKILYKSETAKKQFCSEYKKKWRYPEQVKKKLESAENFIFNAESLLDIANYPPFHFEHLKGDILAECKMIKIVKLTEVSNHYE